MAKAERLLTSSEAYLAMFKFLEGYYERTSADGVGALLGDLQLTEDGKPFDSAVIGDWQIAVRKACGNDD